MAVTALISLLALLALQAAAQRATYFQIGGSLTLNPNHPQAITSITWKHKGNIVAEHIKDVVDLDYLGDFKGRAELNKTTGILTIRNLRKSDDGKFTVEINNIVLPVQFDAVGIEPLPKSLEIIVRPLTCNSHAHNCTLKCGLDFTNVGPVQYFWKKGETGEWKEDEKTIRIFNEEENLGFRTFTCRAKNPFSQEDSKQAVNPFYNQSDSNAGLVAGVVSVVLLIIGGIAGVGFIIYKKYIKKDEGRPPAVQDNGGQAIRDENKPLNTLEPGKDSESPL